MITAALVDPVGNQAHKIQAERGVSFLAVTADGQSIMISVGDDGSYAIADINGHVKKKGWISELLDPTEAGGDANTQQEEDGVDHVHAE